MSLLVDFDPSQQTSKRSQNLRQSWSGFGSNASSYSSSSGTSLLVHNVAASENNNNNNSESHLLEPIGPMEAVWNSGRNTSLNSSGNFGDRSFEFEESREDRVMRFLMETVGPDATVEQLHALVATLTPQQLKDLGLDNLPTEEIALEVHAASRRNSRRFSYGGGSGSANASPAALSATLDSVVQTKNSRQRQSALWSVNDEDLAGSEFLSPTPSDDGVAQTHSIIYIDTDEEFKTPAPPAPPAENNNNNIPSLPYGNQTIDNYTATPFRSTVNEVEEYTPSQNINANNNSNNNITNETSVNEISQLDTSTSTPPSAISMGDEDDLRYSTNNTEKTADDARRDVVIVECQQQLLDGLEQREQGEGVESDEEEDEEDRLAAETAAVEDEQRRRAQEEEEEKEREQQQRIQQQQQQQQQQVSSRPSDAALVFSSGSPQYDSSVVHQQRETSLLVAENRTLKQRILELEEQQREYFEADDAKRVVEERERAREQAQRDLLYKKLEEFALQNDRQNDALRACNERIQEMMSLINDLSDKRGKLEVENKKLQETNDDLTFELKSKGDELEQLKETIQQSKSQLGGRERLEQENAKLNNDLVSLRGEYLKLKSTNGKLQDEYTAVTVSLDMARSQISSLQRQVKELIEEKETENETPISSELLTTPSQIKPGDERPALADSEAEVSASFDNILAQIAADNRNNNNNTNNINNNNNNNSAVVNSKHAKIDENRPPNVWQSPVRSVRQLWEGGAKREGTTGMEWHGVTASLGRNSKLLYLL